MRYWTGLGALVMCLAAAGCNEPMRTQNEGLSDHVAVADKAAALHAAEHVLRGMYFTIEKYDLDAGYIRTHPLRAGQAFELWRRDNADAQAFAHANLESLRRTVEVFLEPQDDAAALRCVVTVEKLALPPQPIRSMSQLARMYTDSTRRIQTLALGPDVIEHTEWVDLGADQALQRSILSRIERRLRD